MRLVTRKINVFATNPWFVVVSGTASILSFLWFLYDKAEDKPGLLSGILFSVCLLILIAGYVYSVLVRSENIALRSVYEILYEINQIYRDKLRELFAGELPASNTEELLAQEEQVLRSICQRIENIYSRLIGRNCMATVKLVTKEERKCFAHTYVRSQELCGRDKHQRIKYAVGTGENTAFDRALERRSDGSPHHYFSPNLVAEEGYSNQRQHFNKHYRSTLVVPIMGLNKGEEATPNEFDLVGFLCVDTLSINRLNSSYHLYILSALASQIYNFMSLMRGEYTVFVE